jgi:hypothetical protein
MPRYSKTVAKMNQSNDDMKALRPVLRHSTNSCAAVWGIGWWHEKMLIQ